VTASIGSISESQQCHSILTQPKTQPNTSGKYGDYVN
jgi:hypothetical protein